MKNIELFNNLIETFEALPSIGKKSATNIALYLVKDDNFLALKLSHAIEEAVRGIKKCKICGGISENEVCDICLDNDRDSSILCIVANIKDIFTIENSKFYQGRYFVFDEISNKNIDNLINAIQKNKTKEVLFAFPPSIQNDAIIYYIEDKLNGFDIVFSKIAQGIPTGVSLENVDSVSLSKAIETRINILPS
jgi:recombination protein RecR